MNKPTDLTLFVKVTPATHKRLAILAAKIGIGKGELYSQAIRWASSHREFPASMGKVYAKKS